MKPGSAVACGAAAEAIADFFVTGRSGKEAFSERAQVEASASGDDGKMAALRDFAECGAGAATVFAGGEGLVGIGYVDEVMWQSSAFRGCGLSGAKIHAAIDGDRVAADDFATELFAEGEGERGLAAAGGTKENDGEGVR